MEFPFLEKHLVVKKKQKTLIIVVVCGEEETRKKKNKSPDATKKHLEEAAWAACVSQLFIRREKSVSMVQVVSFMLAVLFCVCKLQWSSEQKCMPMRHPGGFGKFQRNTKWTSEDGTRNRFAGTNNVSRLHSSIYSCCLLSSSPIMSPSKHSHESKVKLFQTFTAEYLFFVQCDMQQLFLFLRNHAGNNVL